MLLRKMLKLKKSKNIEEILDEHLGRICDRLVIMNGYLEDHTDYMEAITNILDDKKKEQKSKLQEIVEKLDCINETVVENVDRMANFIKDVKEKRSEHALNFAELREKIKERESNGSFLS